MADVICMHGFAAARAMGLDRRRSERVASEIAKAEDVDEAIGMLAAELLAAATDEQEDEHG